MEDEAAVKRIRNRRVALRKSARGRFECRRGDTGLMANLAEKLVDICRMGMRGTLSEAVEPGTEVEVLLMGWGHVRALKVMGNVIWSQPTEDGKFTTGIQFRRAISQEDFQRLTI